MKKFMDRSPPQNKFEEHLDNLADYGFGRDYYMTHRKRFFLTHKWIEKNIADKKILELGEPTQFTQALLDVYGANITNYFKDLRYDFELESNSFDLILNMEVIEHINDRNTDNPIESAEFKNNGVNSFIGECNRVLRPDGTMYLTTPNIHSFDNFYHYADKTPICLYRPHVREYSFWELKRLFESKFNITSFHTNFCYSNYSEKEKPEAWKMLEKMNVDVKDRGDTLFLQLVPI